MTVEIRANVGGHTHTHTLRQLGFATPMSNIASQFEGCNERWTNCGRSTWRVDEITGIPHAGIARVHGDGGNARHLRLTRTVDDRGIGTCYTLE